MASLILPVPKAIYLCDYHIGTGGKVDLYGVFNAIRPKDGFPYRRARFCVFAQLVNGLGKMPFYFDIRYAATGELVWTTKTQHLNFLDRTTLIRLAMTIEGCQFRQAGLYIVDLFCDNTWLCDTALVLLEQ